MQELITRIDEAIRKRTQPQDGDVIESPTQLLRDCRAALAAHAEPPCGCVLASEGDEIVHRNRYCQRHAEPSAPETCEWTWTAIDGYRSHWVTTCGASTTVMGEYAKFCLYCGKRLEEVPCARLGARSGDQEAR